MPYKPLFMEKRLIQFLDFLTLLKNEIYLGYLLFIATAVKKVFLNLKNHVIGHVSGAISVDGNSIASDWILTG